jgi:hypothetical protein
MNDGNPKSKAYGRYARLKPRHLDLTGVFVGSTFLTGVAVGSDFLTGVAVGAWVGSCVGTVVLVGS